MTIEVRNTLVISTSHVTAVTAAMLDTTPLKDWPVVGGPCGEYGWFVYAHDEDVDGKIPVEMMAVFRFARRCGCDYVLFDRDGEVREELDTWEW